MQPYKHYLEKLDTFKIVFEPYLVKIQRCVTLLTTSTTEYFNDECFSIFEIISASQLSFRQVLNNRAYQSDFSLNTTEQEILKLIYFELRQPAATMRNAGRILEIDTAKINGLPSNLVSLIHELVIWSNTVCIMVNTIPSFPLAPIRLAVIDIDGTLVGADLQVTPRVRKAIKAAQDRGVHIALCTGRPEISSRHYAEPLNLYGWHIFDAGASISDPLGGKVLYQKMLPLDVALPIIQYAREHDLYLELYTTGKYFVQRATEHTRIHAELQGVAPIVADLAEVAAQHNIIKLESASLDEAESARVQAMLDHFSGKVDYGWAIAPNITMRFVNILSPGISKGEAVEYLTQHLSLSRAQVMGVGDGPNDEPLLKAVGFPVAMGNSIDSLKQIAAYVAPDVEEDGLAQTIEQFILNVEYRV